MKNAHRLSVARLTPVGRGAVATIRICGDLANSGTGHPTSTAIGSPALDEPRLTGLNSLFRAANGLPLCDQPFHKIAFGQWGVSDVEDLVVCRCARDVLEIHCHGGDAAVQRVLNDLSNAGCQIVDWRDQLKSLTDVLEAECLDVLSRTSTWRTTKIVLEQTNGLLRKSFSQLIAFNAADESSIRRHVDDLLCRADFGLHLSTPWSIVLTGRPNVGKSSLINALLGYQRAIVFDEPGTTRDVVTGETAFDGWPVVIADTAGIRDTPGELEAAGIALARQRLQSADLRMVLIDISQPPAPEDQQIIAEWPDAIVVGHKSDLADSWGDQLPRQAFRVSSVTGHGLSEVQQELVHRLVPTVPPSGKPIPLTQRQVERLHEIRLATTIDKRRDALDRLLV